MTIKHKIRSNVGGKTKVVKLTALSAIRTFCYECMGWNHYEVEKCTTPLCPLFPFRNPNVTKGTRKVSQKAIEALRKARLERQESTKMDNRKEAIGYIK